MEASGVVSKLLEKHKWFQDVHFPCNQRALLFVKLWLKACDELEDIVQGFHSSTWGIKIDDRQILHCTKIIRQELIADLDEMVAPSVAFEIATMREKGSLVGSTTEGRYRSFFSKELIKSHMEKYPLLSTRFSHMLDARTKNIRLCIDRLNQDWPVLSQSSLLAEDLRIEVNQQPNIIHEDDNLERPKHCVLSMLEELASDPHEGGQRVLRIQLTFSCCDILNLVYKPRGRTCQHYLEAFVSQAGIPLRLMKAFLPVNPDTDYFWAEHLECHPCTFTGQVSRFYESCGRLLAVAQCLSFHDGHQENIMACGEHPILIDVETLFEKRTNAMADIEESLLKTALIQKAPIAFDPYNPCYSAAFQTPSNLYIYDEVQVVLHDCTDQMRVVFQSNSQPKFPPSAPLLSMIHENREELEVTRPIVTDFVDDFVRGYLESMERIALSINSTTPIVKDMATKAVYRIIMRPTSFYIRLSRFLNQPHYLSDLQAASTFVEATLAGEVNCVPAEIRGSAGFLLKARDLIAAETEAIIRQDIPIFYSCPSTRDLYLSTLGNIGILDFFDYAEDFVIQVATLSKESSRIEAASILNSLLHQPLKERVLYPESFLNLARKVTDRALACVFSSDPFFYQNMSTFDGNIEDEISTSLRLSLHDGLSGVLVYISASWFVLRDPSYKAMVHQLTDALDLESETFNERCRNIGGTYGLASVVYGISFAAVCTAEPSLLRLAYRVSLAITEDMIDQDNHLDIVNGAAGCALGLLALLDAYGMMAQEMFAPTENELLRAKLLRCGERLIVTAQKVERGYVWPTIFVTGFSHGSAGICFALWRLGSYFGRPDFIDVSRMGVEADDFMMSNGKENWVHKAKDSLDSGSFDACSWCHGAPGILMARLAMKNGASSQRLSYPEAEMFVKSRAIDGVSKSPNDTLCCGLLGQLEALLYCNDTCAFELTSMLLLRACSSGFEIDNRNYGLFQGQGGIVYMLMRLIDSNLQPVCLLQLPKSSKPGFA